MSNSNNGSYNYTTPRMMTTTTSNGNGSTTYTLPRRCVRVREERPHSLYDNIGEEVGRTAAGGAGSINLSTNDDPNGQQQIQQHSLAAGMVTTVPQNVAAPKIEGRHVPTRSSLRHSRMIVLNKQGKEEEDQYELGESDDYSEYSESTETGEIEGSLDSEEESFFNLRRNKKRARIISSSDTEDERTSIPSTSQNVIEEIEIEFIIYSRISQGLLVTQKEIFRVVCF
ncbi:hypothetical protein O3M35_001761 [Rhynocoris fuscipes]|uniref:Uncharacterized protein n=1 Tax=Rhynocoris fuscipes TaxID=488301 RepID=A0AAW1CPJ5_9HEMI